MASGVGIDMMYNIGGEKAVGKVGHTGNEQKPTDLTKYVNFLTACYEKYVGAPPTVPN